MKTRRIEQVRKEDGSVVPYDEGKIAESISAAAGAAGEGQASLGQDLAGVVTMYLERYYERDLPTSDEIRKMVEKILHETGHSGVARAYMDDVRPEPPPSEIDLFPANFVTVEGATRDEVHSWGRDRISEALVKEAGLDPAEAGDIASAVERKIFKLGQRRVSTSLIREVVNQELLSRGRGANLRRQIVVGLPKYDLALLIGGESDRAAQIDPEGLCRTIGETTMRQYALQEILSRDVADAHLEGRIHIHGLEAPLKLWWLAPSVDHVRRYGLRAPGHRLLEDPASTARALTAQLATVRDHARRFFSGGIEFLRLDEAYGSLEGDRRGEAEHIVAALAGAVFGIQLREDPLVTELLELWRSTAGLPAWPDREVIVGSSDTLLKEACRLACERGGVLFLFERGSRGISRFGAGENRSRWHALAQAVTLNLAQAVYRSETGSEFYAELESAVELAVRAHLQKRRLLRRFVHEPTGTFGHEMGWSSNGAGALAADEFVYAVGVSGLNEAVRFLRGSEIIEDEAAQRMALQIASYLFFRLKEEGTKHGMRLALEDYPADEASGRFSRIDGEMYPRARGLLQEIGTYTEGLHARPTEATDPGAVVAVESRFQTLVPSARAVIAAEQRKRITASDLQGILTRFPIAQLHVR